MIYDPNSTKTMFAINSLQDVTPHNYTVLLALVYFAAYASLFSVNTCILDLTNAVNLKLKKSLKEEKRKQAASRN